MFKKLLNVGKGHSHDKLQQQQQQQQKNLFQLNEIRSYGFSHLCCLGHSSSLSLLAVGSKHGLLRVLGNTSVEFSYQLEAGNSIRQIEFIDCRQDPSKRPSVLASEVDQKTTQLNTSAKIVLLTDNGQLHLFELKTVRQQNFADNTTQTETSENCCQQQQDPTSQLNQSPLEFTRLELTRQLSYFRFKPDDDDRSRRVTTLEVAADGQSVHVGTEGGNLYLVPLDKFEQIDSQHQQVQRLTETNGNISVATSEQVINKTSARTEANDDSNNKEDETTAINLNDEPQIEEVVVEPFEMVKFDEHVAPQLGDDIKSKKQGAIESIKRHPASNSKLLLSYHRGLSVIYDLITNSVDKYYYHNQVLECSCFADQNGDFFYTSHNDGSYIKWDSRQASKVKANEDFIGQLYGPYPCKPTPKIQACTGLVNDQLEDMVVFSGGMPRATYDDKNPVTIVRADPDGKDTIKTVLDFTSKVIDFVVITRPRGQLGAGAKSTGGGGGKKNRHKQQQQQRNNPIAVALAILAEEEFVVIDLLNSETYLEFALPYLNCVHSSAITCNQHYSDISDELYEQLLAYNKQQLKGKLSTNEWPITGGKVIEAPEVKSHDILLTGHEDGSVDFWDVSDLSMRHLLHLATARFFSTGDDDLVPIDGENGKSELVNSQEVDPSANNNEGNGEPLNQQDGQSSKTWPPLKRVGRFDPYSDDTRLAVRRLSLCPQTGALVVAGTGGQVLVFELKNQASELESLEPDEVIIVSDQRFTWKGQDKLTVKQATFKFEPGFALTSYVQMVPPVAATSLDLCAEWRLYALGTQYGFYLYDYSNKHAVVTKCTLNVQDFAIVSGDASAGAMSRKKSFRKSLRESFRRLRRGRSQRGNPQSVIGDQQPAVTGVKPAFGAGRGLTTGVRTLNSATGPTAPSAGVEVAAGVSRNVFSAERQVEPKVELSSIVKCITLTSAVITNNPPCFKPSLWVGTNSGQVLVYAITLASESAKSEQQSSSTATDSNEQSNDNSAQEGAKTSAKLTKEIQLKHKAPIIAIFTSPDAPQVSASQSQENASGSSQVGTDGSAKSSPEKHSTEEAERQFSEQQQNASSTEESAEERAQTPVVAQQADKSSPTANKRADKEAAVLLNQQPRVLICSEEQFKVFNLPNLKPFCKFKLTAHEGLRAKKISITQFLKPVANNVSGNSKQQPQVASASSQLVANTGQLSASKSLQSFATQTSPPASPIPPVEGNDEATSGKQTTESNNNSPSTLNNNHTTTQVAKHGSKELMNAKFGAKTNSPVSHEKETELANNPVGSLFEPYMVCMSNQGDCAIYSVPDLKRQAQIQVCNREDINGMNSTMLTNYGEGFYLKSSSNFLRFSISTQRVMRVLSVV